ncbi:hypothetical protein EKO27_g5783 [Xylaria grammica]|uniref:Tyrosinase copper-binding domain-containing protein n=1 Tax=Xylaria grammica TaxID=363999 RepID=A0A439D4K9_9PEZI|nr:hypothetical protein EKO27_g5783 [Xylaria grammica]
MIAPFILALSVLPLGIAEAACAQSIRKSWTDLTAAEKQSYIDADLCLMSAPPKAGIEGATSRWDELQYAHAAQVRYIHSVGAFLPFHRFFVTVHDRLLRDECGYTGPLPYWDEPADAGDITGSSVFTAEPNFGGNGTGNGGCVTDGPFANLTLHFQRNLTTSDYCLSRLFSDRSFAASNSTNVEICLKKETFVDVWNCMEGAIHGAGHGGVGGTMLDLLLSPGDPVFFLHHGYMDRVWYQWQAQNLTTRLTEIGGANTPRLNSSSGGPPGGGFPGGGFPGGFGFPDPNPAIENYLNDGGNVTTLNHTLWAAGILSNVTIGDVMDPTADFVCADYLL